MSKDAGPPKSQKPDTASRTGSRQDFLSGYGQGSGGTKSSGARGEVTGFVDSAREQDQRFIRIATQKGHLSPNAVEVCIEEQRIIFVNLRRFESIDQICLQKGFMTKSQVDEVVGLIRSGSKPVEHGMGGESVGSRAAFLREFDLSNLDKMVHVSAGEFRIHRASGSGRLVEIREYVKDFLIDIYPVTNLQFKKFVEETGTLYPGSWTNGDIPKNKEFHPVTFVSWRDANAYAEWAGKRLPTRLEWEKAGAGQDGHVWPWGDTFNFNNCNSIYSVQRDTTFVGKYPSGRSVYGCFDMSGNVWEWVDDLAPETSETTRDIFRVIKGGSYLCGPHGLKTSFASRAYERTKEIDLGFRCAKDVD